ncbi:uncharacterized protein LOC106477364 [Limulus polyphemus]|uniref:Uncharacterized protein LOC106477364 n=1 Tax=Limulus polyphemus TaxID=6850 RepID=A0ABM1C388_LIMPO|nr:uncharacterized protein LOC106477364 [Limulus polyphemus]
MFLSSGSFADTFSITETSLKELTKSLNAVFNQYVIVSREELKSQKREALYVVECIRKNIESNVQIYPVGSCRTNLHVRGRYDFDFQLRHLDQLLYNLEMDEFQVTCNKNSIQFRKSVFDVCKSSVEELDMLPGKHIEAKEGVKAMQIRITNNHTNAKIKIDVVPAIDVSNSQVVLNKLKKMPLVVKQLELCHSNLDHLSIRKVPIAHILPNEERNVWELDLTPLCKHVLSRLFQNKKAIRILKSLRDKMEWYKSGFYSSHIFTVILLSLDLDPDSSLGRIFVEALLKLYKALEKGYLPDIFHPHKNHFEQVTTEDRESILEDMLEKF